VRITVVGPADRAELLPLLRAYCDVYQVAPGDQALLVRGWGRPVTTAGWTTSCRSILAGR
jgi:hypothetical protein